MFTIVSATLISGFLDSLNPIAISQQFVLQQLIKNKKHIFYYISSIFMTNFICGVLAYYGFLNPILLYIQTTLKAYDTLFMYIKLILLIVLSILFFLQLYKIIWLPKNKKQTFSKPIKFHNVSPVSLIAIGFITTLSELATALPYFAYLSILFNYQLHAVMLFAILFLYNFIYCLPLLLMYFVYSEKHTYFHRFYHFIKKHVTKITPYLSPIICFVLISLIASTFF